MDCVYSHNSNVAEYSTPNPEQQRLREFVQTEHKLTHVEYLMKYCSRVALHNLIFSLPRKK